MIPTYSSGEKHIVPSVVFSNPSGINASFSLLTPALIEEPTEPQKLDGLLRLALQGEIRQNLSDHRSKLESMPGESGPNHHVLVIGMSVDYKILVGGHRVKAGDELAPLRPQA